MSRSVRTRSTRLVSKPSPYHKSVSLFEPGVSDASGSRGVTTLARGTETVGTTDVEGAVSTEQPVMVRGKGRRPPRRQKSVPTALQEPHPAPERWREVYDIIKDMRSRTVAPVDTMGCDQAQFKETEPKARKSFPYSILFT
jgi:endonuclease-3